MIELVNDRKQLKIYVTPEAKTAVEDFARAYDMTEQGVASRLYEWFGKQPRPVKKLMCGLVDSDDADAISAFLTSIENPSQLRGGIRKGSTLGNLNSVNRDAELKERKKGGRS